MIVAIGGCGSADRQAESNRAFSSYPISSGKTHENKKMSQNGFSRSATLFFKR